MSNTSIRLGWSSRDERRHPGIGRHLGLFHMVRVGNEGGRNISVGRLSFDRTDLEPFREKGLRLDVTVVGMLRLSDDVSPALAKAVLKTRVLGWVAADPRTKAALATD
ncbi:MAG TPA: hypothetical protein VF230_06710 [Acidimicrobiales bacterium]